MTEERQTPDYSSFEKYQYGALAARLASSKENAKYVSSALEMLAGSKGLNLGEEALKFHNSFGPFNEKQIQGAINVYAGEFQKERGKYKPIDMAAWYDSVLRDLDKTNKEKILGELSKHGETIGEIMEKYIKAGHDLEGLNKGIKYSEEQISEAKKTIEKYQNIMEILQTLDNYKFEELRPEAVNAARKKDLEGLASNL
jgi:hypothetical protein